MDLNTQLFEPLDNKLKVTCENRFGTKYISGDSIEIYNSFLINMARYLAKNKAKERRTAISITDEFGNFVFGLAVDYEAPANDDDEMPGNWEIVASFDKDNIVSGNKVSVKTLEDSDFVVDLQRLLEVRSRIQINDQKDVIKMVRAYYIALNDTVKECSNTEHGAPFTLNIGNMTVESQVEDGHVVSSIELQGNIKATIKDDTSLETGAIA